MLEKLGEVGWSIFNGCGKGDEEGAWTYAGEQGNSVLDYVIGDEEVWERVTGLEVEDRIDSNHFPVIVWVGSEKGGKGKREGKKRKRWRWTGERKVDFKEKIDRIWEKKGAEEIGWEEIKKEFRASWRRGRERKWWEVGCGMQEEQEGVRKELRRWRKMEDGGERYREVRREYNKLCERKRKEDEEREREVDGGSEESKDGRTSVGGDKQREEEEEGGE